MVRGIKNSVLLLVLLFTGNVHSQYYSNLSEQIKGDWLATDMSDSCYMKHSIKPFHEFVFRSYACILRITETDGLYATAYKSYSANKIFVDTIESNRIAFTINFNKYGGYSVNRTINNVYSIAKDSAIEHWDLVYDKVTDHLVLTQLSTTNPTRKLAHPYIYKRFDYIAAGISEVTYKSSQSISYGDWPKVFDPDKILSGRYETIYRNNLKTIEISGKGYAKGINRIVEAETFQTFERFNVEQNVYLYNSNPDLPGYYLINDRVKLKLKNSPSSRNELVLAYKASHDSLYFYKSGNTSTRSDFVLRYVGPAKHPKSGDLYVTEFSTGFMPGAGYSIYKPTSDSLGTFGGAVLEYLIYASIHQNDRPGPSHVRVYLRMAQLKSQYEKWIQNFTVGVDLSFERNPHRNFLIPYFGLEAGTLLQTTQSSLYHFTPTVGIHVLSTKRIFVNLQTGYLYTTKLVDVFKGNISQATVNFTLW